MIQLKHVSRAYPAKTERKWRALSARSTISPLEVEPGQWIAVMGPSGSGKSTLVNLIGCLDRPSSGEIWLDGENVAGLSTADLNRVRAEKIGFIFQQFHLIPYLTAVENVMLAQYFHSMTDEQEALDALARVGLEDRADHLPSQLSGGEQQRVCIARALINDPKIVLADEPTGNLDAVNEEIVLRLLRELHRQGRTIVMVTHDPVVARSTGNIKRELVTYWVDIVNLATHHSGSSPGYRRQRRQTSGGSFGHLTGYRNCRLLWLIIRERKMSNREAAQCR